MFVNKQNKNKHIKIFFLCCIMINLQTKTSISYGKPPFLDKAPSSILPYLPPPPPRPKKKIFFRPTRFHQFWISKAPVSYEESRGGRGERVGSNYGGWVYTMHGSNRYLIPHIFYFLYNPVPYFESKYQPTPQKNFMDPTR